MLPVPADNVRSCAPSTAAKLKLPAPVLVELIVTAPVLRVTRPLKVIFEFAVVILTPLIVAASRVTDPEPVRAIAPSTSVRFEVVKSILPVPVIPEVTTARPELVRVKSLSLSATAPAKVTVPFPELMENVLVPA